MRSEPPSPGFIAARPFDHYDEAYERARLADVGCDPSRIAECCDRRLQYLKDLRDEGKLAELSVAVDALSMPCPDLGHWAASAAIATAPPVADPEAGSIAVWFGAAIQPSDRIYWASAFIDERHHAWAPLPPGKHMLAIEMHLMPAAKGSRKVERVRFDQEVVVPPRTRLNFVLKLRRNEIGEQSPYRLTVSEQAPTEHPTSTADTPPSELQLEATASGQRANLDLPRFPRDLPFRRPWLTMLRVCVNEHGRVEGVAMVDRQVHPRLFGPILGSFVRAEYHPYVTDGRPVAFCHPARFRVTPG